MTIIYQWIANQPHAAVSLASALCQIRFPHVPHFICQAYQQHGHIPLARG